MIPPNNLYLNNNLALPMILCILDTQVSQLISCNSIHNNRSFKITLGYHHTPTYISLHAPCRLFCKTMKINLANNFVWWRVPVVCKVKYLMAEWVISCVCMYIYSSLHTSIHLCITYHSAIWKIYGHSECFCFTNTLTIRHQFFSDHNPVQIKH